MGEVTVSCCCTAAFLQGLVWWGFAFSISIIFFLQCRFPSHFPPSLVCFHSKTGRSSPFFLQVSFQWISFNRLKTFECNCKNFAGPWSMLCKSVANACLDRRSFFVSVSTLRRPDPKALRCDAKTEACLSHSLIHLKRKFNKTHGFWHCLGVWLGLPVCQKKGRISTQQFNFSRGKNCFCFWQITARSNAEDCVCCSNLPLVCQKFVFQISVSAHLCL